MSRHRRRPFPLHRVLLAAALLVPAVPALADPAQTEAAGTEPPGAASPRAEPMDFKSLYQKAVAFHESVGAARERLKQAAYERDKVFAKLLPRLSVTGSIKERPHTLASSSTIPGFGTFTAVTGPKETRELVVTLGQTLYTGGRATTQYKIATIGQEARDVELRVTRETLIEQLAEAYFGVSKAEADLSSATERREGMEHHVEAAQARVRLGADVRASALRLESELARLKAEEMRAHDALQTARENLALLTGLPVDVELGAPPDMAPIRAGANDSAVAAALDHRADVGLATGEAAAAELGVRYTSGAFLPVVNLEGTYTQRGQDPSGSFLIDEESFATLSATWDLYNGGEDLAERHRAQAQYREKDLDLARLRREVGTEVGQAERRVALAEQVVASLEDAWKYASENHRIVTETFNVGAATYLDVIDASSALEDARRDLENARNDLNLDLLGLAEATGQVMALVGEPVPSTEELARWLKAKD